VTPQGRGTRSRRPSAAGRRKGPEAVTEQKAGYRTADTFQSKVFICISAIEVHCNRSYLRVAKRSARRAQSNTAVAYQMALVRPNYYAQRQVV
jgi:hypothetical protein